MQMDECMNDKQKGTETSFKESWLNVKEQLEDNSFTLGTLRSMLNC